jgi:hypothetical protein
MTSKQDGPGKLSELEADRQGLWNAKDVAGYLRVSRSWVYHQSEAGLLPCLRVGSLLRFDPKVIRRFARGEIQPTNVIALPRKSA